MTGTQRPSLGRRRIARDAWRGGRIGRAHRSANETEDHQGDLASFVPREWLPQCQSEQEFGESAHATASRAVSHRRQRADAR